MVTFLTCAVGREEHCKQISLASVGSSQCLGHTGFAPLTAYVLSPSTLLRLQVALQGAGPELRALPRSKLLRFRFSGTPQWHRLSWACVLCCSPGPSSSGNQVLDERTLFRCSTTSPLPVPASVSRCSRSSVPCVCSGS